VQENATMTGYPVEANSHDSVVVWPRYRALSLDRFSAFLFRARKPKPFANGRATTNRPSRLNPGENLVWSDAQGAKPPAIRSRETSLDLVGKQEFMQQSQDSIPEDGFILRREKLFNIPDYGPKADVIFLGLGPDALLQ
jgi:hypothetical protein